LLLGRSGDLDRRRIGGSGNRLNATARHHRPTGGKRRLRRIEGAGKRP
jgi:hypothetical protein